VKEKIGGATSSLTIFSDSDTLAAIREELYKEIEKKVNK
jgi:hypothetical protein